MASTSSKSSVEVRNWLELPPDIMSVILMKLGAIEILLSAERVCSSWHKLCKEPRIWRSVDMTKNLWNYFSPSNCEFDIEKMAREAVSRSCGELVEFSVEYVCTDELLQYVTDRSNHLRCLRLISCYNISDEGLIEAASKLPHLEELQLTFHSLSKEAFEGVGRLCPRLRSFRLNCQGYRRSPLEYDDDEALADEEALAIAENMPELRHLHLFGNTLTNNGLQAVLDGCPHLESLDLRQCFNINLGGDFGKKCADRITNLRPPDDSTDDYEFDSRIGGFGSFDDEEYPSGLSDIDFVTEDEYYYEFYSSDYSDYGDFIL